MRFYTLLIFLILSSMQFMFSQSMYQYTDSSKVYRVASIIALGYPELAKLGLHLGIGNRNEENHTKGYSINTNLGIRYQELFISSDLCTFSGGWEWGIIETGVGYQYNYNFYEENQKHTYYFKFLMQMIYFLELKGGITYNYDSISPYLNICIGKFFFDIENEI